jgi:hypothetical protein
LFRFEDESLIATDKLIEGEVLTLLQTFQITNVKIDTIQFNSDANWIGLGMR